MKTEIFRYYDNPITFQLADGNVMVSATAMAKSFKKRPAKWLELPSTKEFLTALSTIRKSDSERFVLTINGGTTESGKGTWFHSDVALEFARWLSPQFAIWCNDRIKELLKTGVATISNDDEVIMHAMQVLQNRLKESQQRAAQLQEQNHLQSQELKLSAPKAEYYDSVMMSEDAYCTNRIAKELGMSARTLNRVLKERGVQYKQGDQWLLKHKYQNRGYTKTHTHHFTHSSGEPGTTMSTVWTEKGREWIHSLLKSKS